MKHNLRQYILIVLPLALCMISTISCKKFLEERQVSTLTQNYYNDENGLNSLINGLYVISRIKHEWESNGARLIEPETDAYQTQNPITSARMNPDRYGNSVSFVANTNVYNFLGSANSTFAPMGCYPHINNCNIALDVIDNIKPGKFGTDDVFYKQRRAEILFLRSWAYYLVSNQLGDVPLLLSANRGDNGVYYYPKAKLEDIYKQIISDVRYAFENLAPINADRGRITKWTAGHLLAKLYLNRAQAAGYANSGETHLKMLYKGNVQSDLDSCIYYATEVINGKGGPGGLAPDYWTLFNPAVSETNPHGEVIWAAQFDITLGLNGRFQNRSCNYHIGNYTANSGVARSMAYGRPFSTFKPSDWAYDNFRNKVDDSRYYKTFQYDYISNMPASTSSSYNWSGPAAAWWNTNKPAGEPAVTSGTKRILQGKRAIAYIENQKNEALDSARVMGQNFQLFARWIYSPETGRYYYRLNPVGNTSLGLATGTTNIYMPSRKYIDPQRNGSTSEANFDSENGTRDAILMRLAETFLIRAEALGRKGQYALAVADINVVRARAAYKGGEQRPDMLVLWEPQATTLAPSETTFPYPANGSSITKMNITENIFTPGTPEAIAEGYIATVSSKADAFIHFIYNEKGREFLSEGVAWEDQHNAGILYDRVVYLNQMASDRSGLWPIAYNTENGNGQNGNGKGQMKKHYTFRPWPNNYLVQLTDENGKPLDAAAIAAYQNPGY